MVGEEAYLLFLGVELDELLEEDHEEGDTDHAYEADAHASETTEVSLWVVVAVANCRHSHKTHPQGVEEVAEVLINVFVRIRLLA